MTSHSLISNLTKDWIETIERWQLQLFSIPSAIITFVTFITSPVLLMCILMSHALRNETRYMLVANTLVADILFLILHSIKMITNVVRAEMPFFVCHLLTAFIVTASSCAIITVTLMVINTFTAVRWPLQYHNFFSPSRTGCIIGMVWLLCAIYPFTLVMMMKDEIPNDKVTLCLTLLCFGFFKLKNMGGIEMYFFVAGVICTILIFYCYIRLYMVTRTQGIWHRRFSRARVTVLVHGVLLLLYFVPGLVFALEIYTFKEKNFSHDVCVWISTVNSNIFLLLPRVFTPCLFGLRYREIYESLARLLYRYRRNRESIGS